MLLFVNAITLGLSQSDHIKRLLLYSKKAEILQPTFSVFFFYPTKQNKKIIIVCMELPFFVISLKVPFEVSPRKDSTWLFEVKIRSTFWSNLISQSNAKKKLQEFVVNVIVHFCNYGYNYCNICFKMCSLIGLRNYNNNLNILTKLT